MLRAGFYLLFFSMAVSVKVGLARSMLTSSPSPIAATNLARRPGDPPPPPPPPPRRPPPPRPPPWAPPPPPRRALGWCPADQETACDVGTVCAWSCPECVCAPCCATDGVTETTIGTDEACPADSTPGACAAPTPPPPAPAPEEEATVPLEETSAPPSEESPPPPSEETPPPPSEETPSPPAPAPTPAPPAITDLRAQWTGLSTLAIGVDVAVDAGSDGSPSAWILLVVAPIDHWGISGPPRAEAALCADSRFVAPGLEGPGPGDPGASPHCEGGRPGGDGAATNADGTVQPRWLEAIDGGGTLWFDVGGGGCGNVACSPGASPAYGPGRSGVATIDPGSASSGPGLSADADLVVCVWAQDAAAADALGMGDAGVSSETAACIVPAAWTAVEDAPVDCGADPDACAPAPTEAAPTSSTEEEGEEEGERAPANGPDDAAPPAPAALAPGTAPSAPAPAAQASAPPAAASPVSALSPADPSTTATTAASIVMMTVPADVAIVTLRMAADGDNDGFESAALATVRAAFDMSVGDDDNADSSLSSLLTAEAVAAELDDSVTATGVSLGSRALVCRLDGGETSPSTAAAAACEAAEAASRRAAGAAPLHASNGSSTSSGGPRVAAVAVLRGGADADRRARAGIAVLSLVERAIGGRAAVERSVESAEVTTALLPPRYLLGSAASPWGDEPALLSIGETASRAVEAAARLAASRAADLPGWTGAVAVGGVAFAATAAVVAVSLRWVRRRREAEAFARRAGRPSQVRRPRLDPDLFGTRVEAAAEDGGGAGARLVFPSRAERGLAGRTARRPGKAVGSTREGRDRGGSPPPLRPSLRSIPVSLRLLRPGDVGYAQAVRGLAAGGWPRRRPGEPVVAASLPGGRRVALAPTGAVIASIRVTRADKCGVARRFADAGWKGDRAPAGPEDSKDDYRDASSDPPSPSAPPSPLASRPTAPKATPAPPAPDDHYHGSSTVSKTGPSISPTPLASPPTSTVGPRSRGGTEDGGPQLRARASARAAARRSAAAITAALAPVANALDAPPPSERSTDPSLGIDGVAVGLLSNSNGAGGSELESDIRGGPVRRKGGRLRGPSLAHSLRSRLSRIGAADLRTSGGGGGWERLGENGEGEGGEEETRRSDRQRPSLLPPSSLAHRGEVGRDARLQSAAGP